MSCSSCGSDNLGKFTGEAAVHFPGRENIDEPTVFIFPELVICLACGLTEFTVPNDELRVLSKRDALGR
jgi:hypothetical protein